MRLAIELAKAGGNVGEVPVGAIVVFDNEVIGEGSNRSILDSDPSAHAEIVALRVAARQQNNYRLPNAILYATIEPCSMCASAIIHARIETVVFGAADPKAGAAGSVLNLLAAPYLNHQCNVIGGILEGECSQLMKDFFQQKRHSTKLQRSGICSD